MTADRPEALAAALARVLGGAEVGALEHLSGGASRETWSFTASSGHGAPRTLIVQLQRPGSERDVEVEASLLQVARTAGVPVPEVVAASMQTEALGTPFLIVTAVAGETIPRRILRNDAFGTARAALPAQLARALAALHAVTPRAVPGLTAPDQVQQCRDALDQLGQPHPAFELGFRWLAANRPADDPPAARRTTIVHGDFRLGNFVVDERGLVAVLDWELAHIGDPMEDLGWLCIRAWRFGGALPAAGLAGYDELFDAYADASGCVVDPAVVRWWEVLGTLKWGIMGIMQVSAHLTGTSRSHELAVIGRRVCENEHDLLVLLG